MAFDIFAWSRGVFSDRLGAARILSALEARITALEAEATTENLQFLGIFADETAIRGIAAAARQNGSLAQDATNDVIWMFDSGSSAGASAWVLVPSAGTGRWLRQDASLADLASTAAAKGAHIIGYQDSLSLTAATTVAGVLDEVLQDAKSTLATVDIPLSSFTDADGDPLAKFVDEANPTFGYALADNEAQCIRWNNDAAPGTALGSVLIPPDLDDTADAFLEFLCSKSGATIGDATTLTLTAFLLVVGDLHDADANAGGVTNALVGDAVAKTTALLSRTIALADIQPGAWKITFTLTPTAGVLGTDDLLLHGARLRYKRKPRAS